MSIWKNEYLRYKYFWGTIFGIELLLDILHILHILPMVEGVDMIYSIWQMLSWVGIVFLTIYDLFSFFYLNKDRMLHLLYGLNQLCLEHICYYFSLLVWYAI